MEKAFNERHQGVLPRNTIPNPREDIKVITTRTGITLTGHSVPPPHPSSSSKEVERDPKPTMDQIEECMALDDLGANINLMPLSVWKKLMIPELVPTRMTLELANRTVAYPAGIPEDVFMQVVKSPSEEMINHLLKKTVKSPAKEIVNSPPEGIVNLPPEGIELLIRLLEELLILLLKELLIRLLMELLIRLVNSPPEGIVNSPPKGIVNSPPEEIKHGDESINQIDIIDTTCKDHFHEVLNVQKLIHPLSGNPTPSPDPIVVSLSLSFTPFGDSDFLLEEINAFLALDDSIPPEINNGIYNLPPHLEYAFLEGTSKLPVIIAKDMKKEEKDQLIKVLKSNKRAIAWKLSDIRGIDPNFYTHKILIEDDFKPAVYHQRKVLGLVLCTGWHVFIDYRKLNDATRKDYFPFPFIDQMLEHFAGNEFYCFLDGFSRMSFGLCNAPGTFQRCMVAIFHDMIEKTMEFSWLIFRSDTLWINRVVKNYVLVVAGNQTNGIAGTKDNIVAGQAQKEKEPEQEYILIPFCITDPLISQGPKDSKEDAGMKPTEVNESKASNKGEEDDQDTRSEFERLLQQEKQTKHPNSTNSINTVSTPVSSAGPSLDNTARTIDSTANAFEENIYARFSPFKNASALPYVPNVFSIDDTRIFGNAYDDVEEEVDMNNVDTSYTASDAPFTKFLKGHPQEQVIGSLKTPIQTRHMTKINEEHGLISSVHKLRRTN
ncbi:hypothetical protein Tco_0643605, partial [Tanacetum coccineum]